jgi:hypothetical protein
LEHQVKITAQNGVGVATQQTLTFNIVSITAPAPVSGCTRNGNTRSRAWEMVR